MIDKNGKLIPELIVIHCSATPPDMDIGVKEIDIWHRRQRFLSIGYHFVIRRDGTLEIGRPVDQPGAHAHGHNDNAIGICLVGGVKRIADRDGEDDIDGPRWDLIPENNYTVAQMDMLYGLTSSLIHNNPTVVDMCGHNQLPNVTKACPSFDVTKWEDSHSSLGQCLDANFAERKP